MRTLYAVRSEVDRVVREKQQRGREVEVVDADIMLADDGRKMSISVQLSDNTFVETSIDLKEPLDPCNRRLFAFYRDEMETAFSPSKTLH